MYFMNIRKMRLATIILVSGLILAAVSCLTTCIMKEPTIKEHAFDYSVTYRLDGAVKTYEGSFQRSFNGYDEHDDPTARQYTKSTYEEWEATIFAQSLIFNLFS